MRTKRVLKPTDYARGTVMEPEQISTLKASFGEYEALGNKHRDLSERIDALREKMKVSRQRGAFQALQDQMREVKTLVKEREDIDAKMAVADLARKKDDDHRLAVKQEVSYTEQLDSVASRIAQLESMMVSFAESSADEYDFARCQRPDGSFYGTRGKCKKGTDAGAAAPRVAPAKTGKRKAKPSMAEISSKVKEVSLAAKQARAKVKQAEREAKKAERETKGDNSIEARRRRIQTSQAWGRAQRDLDKIDSLHLKLSDMWHRQNRKQQRAKMSPEARKEERKMDRTIREMG